MKIALIQCPVWGTYDPPMALAQLASCLRRDGQEVFVFDLNIKLYTARTKNYKHMWAWEQWIFWCDEKNVDKFFIDNKSLIEKYIDEILDAEPKIIGFSVNSGSKLSSIKVAKMIKNINKDIIIIFGGPLFFEKRSAEYILNEDAVDIVMFREGEFALVELLRLIDSKKNISNYAGIAFKDNGKLVYTEPKEPIDNLDLLPFLDFSDLPLSDYNDSRHISFMASRGCIQRCVFCSSRVFWPGYRAMSGERIFKEIQFHKMQLGKINPDLCHVDFLDLVFNGNMNSLIEFCDLVIKSKLGIFWTANMIIRPEMTSDVIKRMKDAGCQHVIFGIESGSQRILDLMRKHYCVEDAYRIIRWMHEIDIIITCNFMFGFPGENYDDFQKTLDFLKRNADYLNRVYPSRTYCGIEEFSYLYGHLEEFGIKPNPADYLFWESSDGTNTYLERLRRCREFSQIATSLGIEVGNGVQTSVELDELFNLSRYYELKNDHKNALECLLKYFDLEPSNEIVRTKIQHYFMQVDRKEQLPIYRDDTLQSRLTVALDSIKFRKESVLSRGDSSYHVNKKAVENASMLSDRDKNLLLNDFEYNEGKTTLESTPEGIGIGAHYNCNAKCIFCLGEKSKLFSLKRYKDFFEPRLGTVISNARFVNFCGFGELLLMPEIEKFLDYVNKKTPEVNKIYTTNGTPLMNNQVLARLTQSKSVVEISLHASNSQLHRFLTNIDAFNHIESQIRKLLSLRKRQGYPTVSLVFLLNTLNIEDLPDFVKFSANLGVDEVICSYMTVFKPVHLKLSCFFKQEIANDSLNRAEERAHKLSLSIRLPPKFKEKSKSDGVSKCSDPWKYCYVENESSVLACCYAGSHFGYLGKRDFEGIWNGADYRYLRSSLVDNLPHKWCRYCYKYRSENVNDIRSHINSRPGFRDEILKEIASVNYSSRI